MGENTISRRALVGGVAVGAAALAVMPGAHADVLVSIPDAPDDQRSRNTATAAALAQLLANLAQDHAGRQRVLNSQSYDWHLNEVLIPLTHRIYDRLLAGRLFPLDVMSAPYPGRAIQTRQTRLARLYSAEWSFDEQDGGIDRQAAHLERLAIALAAEINLTHLREISLMGHTERSAEWVVVNTAAAIEDGFFGAPIPPTPHMPLERKNGMDYYYVEDYHPESMLFSEFKKPAVPFRVFGRYGEDAGTWHPYVLITSSGVVTNPKTFDINMSFAMRHGVLVSGYVVEQDGNAIRIGRAPSSLPGVHLWS